MDPMQLATWLLALTGISTGYISAPSVPHSGIAKHYSPGTMERVVQIRHLRVPPAATSIVSTPDCSLIGRSFWISVRGHREWAFQADCSAPRDRERHLREGLVVEVDYRTAVRDGIVYDGKGPATVWLPTLPQSPQSPWYNVFRYLYHRP